MIDIKFSDKELECKYCQATFIFTKDEQKYYLEKGFMKPVRCSECRKVKQRIWKEKRKEKERNQQKFIADMAGPSLPVKKLNQKLEVAEHVKIEIVPALVEAKETVEDKKPAKKKAKKIDKVMPILFFWPRGCALTGLTKSFLEVRQYA